MHADNIILYCLRRWLADNRARIIYQTRGVFVSHSFQLEGLSNICSMRRRGKLSNNSKAYLSDFDIFIFLDVFLSHTDNCTATPIVVQYECWTL